MVLDSGLSYAMMPKSDMIELIKILKDDYNIDCQAKNLAKPGESQSLAYTAEQLALPSCTCKDN